MTLPLREPDLFHANRGAGLFTPMVGRSAELERLQEALDTVLEEGGQQVLLIVGPAGMGKSRLLNEFEQWARAHSRRPFIFKGQARAERQNLPFDLVGNIVGTQLGIRASDSPEEALEKLAHGLAQADGPAPADELGQLLGFRFDPHAQPVYSLKNTELMQDMALTQLADYFLAQAARRPLLLLLEDLHWADPSSIEALRRLPGDLAPHPLLIVGTARPEFDYSPGQGTVESRVEIGPLATGESAQLATELLARALPAQASRRDRIVAGATILSRRIVALAEGSPLLVHELVRLLAEKPGNELPATPDQVVPARLAGLPAEERAVLQRAAVIGTTFWAGAVCLPGQAEEAATAAALAALEERGFVFQRGTSTLAGTTEYAFQHELLAEAAYREIETGERRSYHAHAAEWLLAQTRSRPTAGAGLVANHLEQAGQPGPAITYMGLAGQQALHAGGYQEASSFCERALALLPSQDSVRGPLAAMAGEALYHLRNYPAARRRLEESIALARQAGTIAASVSAVHRLGLVAREQGDFALARDCLAETIAFTRETGDQARTAQALIDLGWVDYRLGMHEEARGHMEEGLAYSQSAGDKDAESHALNGLASIATRQGDFARARQALIRRIELNRQMGDRNGEAVAFNNLGVMAWLQKAYVAARQYYEQALSIMQKAGNLRNQANTTANLGLVEVALGDYGAAQAHFYQALQVAMSIGFAPVALEALGGLAAMLAHQGQTDRPLELLGLVLHHPALRIDTKVNAQLVVDFLQRQVGPAACAAGLARGQNLRLEEVAGEVLEGAR